jgi:hypothetical protein
VAQNKGKKEITKRKKHNFSNLTEPFQLHRIGSNSIKNGLIMGFSNWGKKENITYHVLLSYLSNEKECTYPFFGPMQGYSRFWTS